MGYSYQFDHTIWEIPEIDRTDFLNIHEGLLLLRREVVAWNRRAIESHAVEEPYKREARDLDRLTEKGANKLIESGSDEIEIGRIAIGNLRYFKAALLLLIDKRKKTYKEEIREDWPDTALKSVAKAIDKIQKFADSINVEPSDILWEILPKQSVALKVSDAPVKEWDVFVSHASEDKDNFARPLAKALQSQGLNVWFDEFTLKLGDSLRRSIDRGLANSKFGVVVISPNFLQKEWPQKELDGLVTRERNGRKVVLPIWHDIKQEQVASYSPTLADRMAVSSERGLGHVVAEILRAIGRQ